MRIIFSFLVLIYFSTNLHSQEHRNIIWFTEKSPTNAYGFEEGQTVPNLSIKDVHKKRVNLYDQLDKLTIVDFRSIDCDACAKNNKYLKNFYEKHSIQIISIYNDERSILVKDYARKNGLIWTNIQDNAPKREKLEKQLNLEDAYPDYIIISPDKKVLKVFGGVKGAAKLGVFLQQYFK